MLDRAPRSCANQFTIWATNSPDPANPSPDPATNSNDPATDSVIVPHSRLRPSGAAEKVAQWHGSRRRTSSPAFPSTPRPQPSCFGGPEPHLFSMGTWGVGRLAGEDRPSLARGFFFSHFFARGEPKKREKGGSQTVLLHL